MRFKRRNMLVAAAAVAVLATTGCANAGAASDNPAGKGTNGGSGPYKIGFLAPLSGPLSNIGLSMKAGIEAEANIINANGGVNNRQIELDFKDDQGTPDVGVAAVNEFAREGVDAILGGYSSSVTLAVQPVSSRAGLLNFIAGSQTGKMFDGTDPNALRINVPSGVGGYGVAEYVKTELKAKTVGILWENSAYGTDAVGQFKANLGDVKVASEAKFETADTDFRTAIGNVTASKPDVIITFASQLLTIQPQIMKQLAASGTNAKLLAGFGTISQGAIDLVGSAGNGWISADTYYPSSPPFSDYAANKAFLQEFDKVANGIKVDRWAALPAESLQVWKQAVESIGGETDATKVANAIKGHNFKDTIFGDVSFTEQGQMKAPVQIYAVDNGKPKSVAKIDVPDAVWHVNAG
jgi:branched-chain amino acid transport system substrate-binding protein